MGEYKGIGYKNSYSSWALLTGGIFSLILTIVALVAQPDNYILFVVLLLLLAVVCFISFVVERKRPNIVVFLSDNGVKVLKGFRWKIISFDDIDYVDYKLNVFRKIQSILFGVGDLIVDNKTQKVVVRNIENVRDCYEEITETLKKYRNVKKEEKSE